MTIDLASSEIERYVEGALAETLWFIAMTIVIDNFKVLDSKPFRCPKRHSVKVAFD